MGLVELFKRLWPIILVVNKLWPVLLVVAGLVSILLSLEGRFHISRTGRRLIGVILILAGIVSFIVPASSPPPPPCNLRSQNSNVRAAVEFVNASQRAVALYWLNYEGLEEFYTELSPDQSWFLQGYVTHPWCIRDVYTGEIIEAVIITETEHTFTIH